MTQFSLRFLLGAVALCGACSAIVSYYGPAGAMASALAVGGAVFGLQLTKQRSHLAGIGATAGGAFGSFVGVELTKASVMNQPALVLFGAIVGGTLWIISYKDRFNLDSSQSVTRKRNLQIFIAGIAIALLVSVIAFAVMSVVIGIHRDDIVFYFCAHLAIGFAAGLAIVFPYAWAYIRSFKTTSCPSKTLDP